MWIRFSLRGIILKLVMIFLKRDTKYRVPLVLLASFTLGLGLSGLVLAAAGVSFERNLSRGSSGIDVWKLQQLLNRDKDTEVAVSGPGSPGAETFFFGPATEAAVKRFQEKYRTEVLSPVGLSHATGYVGPLTRAKLALVSKTNLATNTKTEVPSTPVSPSPAAGSGATVRSHLSVSSVYPTKVRSGNTVTIYGEGFTSTGNTVTLSYGSIEKRLDNLPSPDGKRISFTFYPPVVRAKTEAEIKALPGGAYEKIAGPVRSVGATLADVLAPYKGMKSEAELSDFLGRNGHTFDELYDYFYVIVENTNGKIISSGPLLYGLRYLPFNLTFEKPGRFFSRLGLADFVKKFVPTAYAQGSGQAGGGFNSGIVMYCTCGGGFLAFLQDVSV